MFRLRAALFALSLLSFGTADNAAESQSADGEDGVDVRAERPFDAVNIFGTLRRLASIPDTDENKLWWERMVRGEVGKERFLILCSLKDGDWKSLIDIRTYLEFQLQQGYSAKKLYRMLVLMAGKPYQQAIRRNSVSPRWKAGEGWLEKNPGGEFTGVNTTWRIAPSVLPLLYFLLMSCSEENRCE